MSAPNTLPDNPTEEIQFAIYGDGIQFTPMYYPSRFTITTDKELQKTSAGCEGQKVDIKTLKNSVLHVTGRVHASDLPSLRNLAEETQPVDVITPIIVGGGMEAIPKKVERGEVVGWDAYPTAQEWLIKYTIDLVSTGADEYQPSESSSRYVLEDTSDSTEPSTPAQPTDFQS